MSLDKGLLFELALREGWVWVLMSEPEDLPGGPQGSCGVQ